MSFRPRSSETKYTAAYLDWLGHVDRIIARNLITRGGSVIAYQVENEYDGTGADPAYMQRIEDKAHADGIDVPLLHNNIQFDPGQWASGEGAPGLIGVDSYYQNNDCYATAWGQPPADDVAALQAAAPDNPGVVPELESGFYDGWGGPNADACQYTKTNADYDRVFVQNMLGQGATSVSNYLGVGGTFWGWEADNVARTSSDQGAGINEEGQLTAKANQLRLLGYLATTVSPLTKTDPAASPTPPDNPAVQGLERINRDTGTHFYAVRDKDVNNRSPEFTHLAVDTPLGDYPSVPKAPDSSLQFSSGHQGYLLTADYQMGQHQLVYSTSQLVTNAQIGDRQVALLYGDAGQPGETVLRYPHRPTVRVLSGTAGATWDAGRVDLRLNYTHHGITRVEISGPDTGQLLLLLADRPHAERIWRVQTPAGPALVTGPYLVDPTAAISGPGSPAATLRLTGESTAATPLDVIAAPPVNRISWNGRLLAGERGTAWESLASTVPGPVVVTPSYTRLGVAENTGQPAGDPGGGATVTLPALGQWRYQAGSPEIQPGFDDSGWTAADHTTTNNPTPPSSLPVLYADDYGFHHGDVWYRGHFTATGSETGITLDGSPGNATVGQYSVWLNGTFLGSLAAGQHMFAFPVGSLRPGADNVVSVLVENMGHSNAASQFQQPRGLRLAKLEGGNGATLSWRIQGTQGGERPADTVRGVLNNGGLYGERHGWTLPGYSDAAWSPITLPDTTPRPAGVGWYRTQFDLNLPAGEDIPIGLHIDNSAPRPYRALVFLNGWQLGRFISNIGPDDRFYLPAGILNPHGHNTLALAVWTEQPGTPGLPSTNLFAYGSATTPNS